MGIARKLWSETHPTRASGKTGADAATPEASTARPVCLGDQRDLLATPNGETKPIQIPRPHP
jgi:hypothetical protein